MGYDVMMLFYLLKASWFAAIAVVADLAASGNCLLVALGIPMIALMWYATRLYARRRARPGGRW